MIIFFLDTYIFKIKQYLKWYTVLFKNVSLKLSNISKIKFLFLLKNKNKTQQTTDLQGIFGGKANAFLMNNIPSTSKYFQE